MKTQVVFSLELLRIKLLKIFLCKSLSWYMFMLCLCFLSVAQTVKNLPLYRRPRFDPSFGKTPWRREGLPNLLFLRGEFHGKRSTHGVSKKLDMTEQLTLLLFTFTRFPPGEYLREELLSSNVIFVFLCIKKIVKLFLKMTVVFLSYQWCIKILVALCPC